MAMEELKKPSPIKAPSVELLEQMRPEKIQELFVAMLATVRAEEVAPTIAALQGNGLVFAPLALLPTRLLAVRKPIVAYSN